MKPPPTVEEIGEIILKHMEWDSIDEAAAARAILARVRESVPHVAYPSHTHEACEICQGYCETHGGRCDWEVPR